MSKDQYTKEDELKDKLENTEINDTAEEVKTEVEENEEVEEKEEPTTEELIKVEKDKYLRLFAEFENYKKRTTKERIELLRIT